MKTVYRVLRTLSVLAICLAVVAPVVLFVALSLPAVQGRVARQCETELTKLLGCKVSVGGLGIVPFNRAVLRNVVVETAPGDTALTVRRLGAGVRLMSIITDEPVTVSYVELQGMNLRVHADSAGAPLNIQPVIDALSPKDKNKPPTRFDLKINTVMIRGSRLSYDIGPRPEADGRFNPQHVAVDRLRADLRLPRLRNGDFVVDIKRMAFAETFGGFTLDNLSGHFAVADSLIATGNVQIELPASSIRLDDMTLPLAGGLKHIGDALKTGHLKAGITEGSHLNLADLGAFVPKLRELPVDVQFGQCMVSGNTGHFSAGVHLSFGESATLRFSGEAASLRQPAERLIDIETLSVKARGAEIGPMLQKAGLLPAGSAGWATLAGDISAEMHGTLHGSDLKTALTLAASPGKIKAEGHGKFTDARDFNLAASVATDGPIDLYRIFPNSQAGGIEGDMEATLSRKGKTMSGTADLEIDRAVYRGVTYEGLMAHATLEDEVVRGVTRLENQYAHFHAEGAYSIARDSRLIELQANVGRFAPAMLNLTGNLQGAEFSGGIDMALEGPDFSHLQGMVSLNKLRFQRADGEAFTLDNFVATAMPERITVRSDYLDGEITGTYEWPALLPEIKCIASTVFPTLVTADCPDSADIAADEPVNDFRFDFTIKETEKPAGFFRLPVSVVYPARISGAISTPSGDIALNIRMPYLRQGNKLIENTYLGAFTDREAGTATLDFTTTAPTKNGPMRLLLQATGENDGVKTGISWKIDRREAYEGEIEASALFSRNADAKLLTEIDLHHSELTFNDSTWTVDPAKISIAGPREIEVDGIHVHHADQYVKIEGKVSDDPWEMLTLDLRDFSLDYLFETLGIDKVMLGGDATGTFYASNLLSQEPALETPGLSVKGISYNKVVLGDATVLSRWEPLTRGITLDATIDSEEGRRSLVNGAIYPLNDSLDLTFTVDRAKVGFMQPYMAAFASDISGYASGKARLWGTFKYIDLEGDVFADELRLKVNFTNTFYTATDSVHFRPGLIDLNGITIRDTEGHAAHLNGWVRHKFFKEPRFEFGVTDAHNFLSYNTTSRDNPVWYGKIYGTGSAFVKGEPGRVNINVDMATAPKSVFTFVLSDQEVADEFSFLTFRDKNGAGAELTDTLLLERDTSMDLVNRLRAMAMSHDAEEASDYDISLQMRVTPEAQLNLVMDPVGGDRIRANGSGHLRMDYGSANNDLRMYGTYTLDRGSYNFTLQDIIIKDFTIKPGSRINFSGDPYNAGLDIQAVYALNANLSDLDESFLQDKDLNRTNVPVHAVLKVAGDLVSPEISFDLEFPTLTTDIYRKVRSIISTDDMMNRQIIYLLALNRFYTPDYMASTTKGNELVSVASSTISSQLSNLLGSISDNWNIAPTFRSDRGDFSDVEVDVALSSRLLNNRLLFNGNFGYRDNSLNTTQFIGDFDLEYLLDRSGMWRLKAYNRYNDQNYYLRTAPTTQGVGVVLKKDFDSFTSFLRPLLRRSPGGDKTPSDTPSTPHSGTLPDPSGPASATVQPDSVPAERETPTVPAKAAPHRKQQ